MVLGFLGKGGSGKSTLATLMARFLHARGESVLAIDADHNMDLSYNLGVTSDDGPYIGGTFESLKELCGIADGTRIEELFVNTTPVQRFSLSPLDAFTAAHTIVVAENLRIMMSGPQNDAVLHGTHCSHSLAAPLKLYLPLLKLAQNEFAIVDEKASVDAVTTGIPTGFDLAVIVAEPREHSVRVAKQIAAALTFYDVPFCFALNKVRSREDVETFVADVGTKPIVVVEEIHDTTNTETLATSFEDMLQKARSHSTPNISRLERSIKKFTRNHQYTPAA